MTSSCDRNVGRKEGNLADQLLPIQVRFVEKWLEVEGVPPLDVALANDYASQARDRGDV